jgi:hypothetical protein
MSKLRENLFKRHFEQPDRLVEEVQRSATEHGWKAPWVLEEQREEEQRKKQKAAKKSVAVRRQRAQMRLRIVQQVWEQLDPKFKCEPYSTDSVNALCEKYFFVVSKPAFDGDRLPRTPPTEDELKSFALAVESISQLPEEDRESALRDEVEVFLYPSPLTEKQKDEIDFLMLEDNFELWISILELSKPDRENLQNVSLETLKSDLKSLGVRGKPTRRPR